MSKSFFDPDYDTRLKAILNTTVKKIRKKVASDWDGIISWVHYKGGCLDRSEFKIYHSNLYGEDRPLSERTHGELCSFNLSLFPMNSDMAVSYSCYIYSPLRRRGIGTILQECKEKFCRVVGVNTLLCTVTKNNEAQRKLLHNTGWQPLTMGVNSILYCKKIPVEPLT